jgi:hypothetical protein
MQIDHKFELLRLLCAEAQMGKAVRFSFSSVSRSLGLTKDKIELFLVELNKERFIAQYSKKGVDGFMAEIKQQGLDAVEDESFI